MGINMMAGEAPIVFQCLTCSLFIVRTYLKADNRVCGGPEVLTALPRAVTFGFSCQQCTWVSTACARSGIMRADFRCYTFAALTCLEKRYGCPFLGGDHHIAGTDETLFRDRWESLCARMVPDASWDKEVWMDEWMATLPGRELKLSLEWWPEHTAAQSGTPRRPVPFGSLY